MKFTPMLPVQIEARSRKQLKEAYAELKDLGWASHSSNGVRVEVNADSLRLKDVRAAFNKAEETL